MLAESGINPNVLIVHGHYNDSLAIPFHILIEGETEDHARQEMFDYLFRTGGRLHLFERLIDRIAEFETPIVR